MIEIIPAIIPESFEHLHDEVAKVKDFVSLVQIDIADGIFVKNKTWPYVGDNGGFEKLLKEEIGLPFWEDVDYEFHLMIDEPEENFENWIKIGANGIIVQIESVKDTEKSMEAIIQMAKATEVNLGISLLASTHVSKIGPYGSRIDFIQCMGSDDLGHHNASLDTSVFEKIKELRTMYPNLPIAIDIGVNKETAKDFISAGATKLISGGAIFESANIPETIEFFQNI